MSLPSIWVRGYEEVFRIERTDPELYVNIDIDFESYEAALDYGTQQSLDEFRITRLYRKKKNG